MKRKTWFYPLSLVIIFAGFAIFLTSKNWFHPEQNYVAATPYGRVVADGNMETVLYRWDYSKEQRLMEVEVGVSNLVDTGNISYEFGAISNRQGQLDVNAVANEGSIIILRIADVPSNFTEIALLTGDSLGHVSRIYTNRNSVNNVDWINDLSAEEYITNHYQTLIARNESTIESIIEANEKREQEIASHQEKMDELNAQLQYQTSSQQEKSTQAITQHKDSITDLQRTIESEKARVEELKKSNEQLQQILDKRLSG